MTIRPELMSTWDEQGKDNDELVFFLFTVCVLDLSLRFLGLALILRHLVALVVAIDASSCFGSGTFIIRAVALAIFSS
jgi:hypothetical protein